jgi:soluble lytic murein transglycosylase
VQGALHAGRLDTDTRAWARYHAARAYGRIGRWNESIRQYEHLEAEAPAHRLADDASYRAALAELELGNRNPGLARLASIPKRYPAGDIWPRALFKLGWLQLRQGSYDAAYERFDELVKRGGDERMEGITGRANYWRARMLFTMGRRIDAADAYEEIVKRWPLRYYAQQSLWRLREIDPERAKAIVEDMRAGDEPTRMVFAWRDDFDDPAFARLVELLAVDEVTYASTEMTNLHMLGDDVDPEMAVVGAVLLQHAGAETKLSRVIRRHFEDFEGLLPKGEGRLIWEATYPQAFSPLIEKVASNEGLPPSFVRAIAREESSFNPDAVSWAKAYGLVQLIMPTARRFAGEVGERATPRTLTKPDVNLKIGARYMAWLWNRLNQNPALVPSAYNAGEGAVRRWLEEDSARPLDVFIEEIPYDETRRYTRRVLQTYGVYQWLAEENLPALPAKLPETSTPQRFSARQ